MLTMQVVFDTISPSATEGKDCAMVKLFYSYNDGSMYVLHKECPLELLMKEQAGGDGLLIFASKKAFEIVEYMNGVESGFTTRIVPKVKEPLSGFMCDMDKCINEFFTVLEGIRASC